MQAYFVGQEADYEMPILRNNAGNYVVIRTETPAGFLQSSVTFVGLQFNGLRSN